MTTETSTRVCTFRLEPEGYVRATMSEGAVFEIADATEALATTWRVAGEQRRAVLVDMRGVRAQSREAREYFVEPEIAARVSAVALLVASPVSKMVGNFFLRLRHQPVPTRLFDSETDAEEWLLELGE